MSQIPKPIAQPKVQLSQSPVQTPEILVIHMPPEFRIIPSSENDKKLGQSGMLNMF